MKINPFIIVLATLLCLSELCEGGFFGTRKTVTIMNELAGKSQLLVHCKSKNDDLGPHVLKPGQIYEFRFKPNVFFLKNTLFYCSFNWDSGDNQWYDIYNDRQESSSNCKTCVWKIKEDGPCRLQIERGGYVCYPWKQA